MEARKIQFSICSQAGVSHESFPSFTHMQAYSLGHSNHTYSLGYAKRTFIHMARTRLVEEARAGNCDYILWLDDDMIWPPNLAVRLVQCAEKHGLDIVSGYYCTRSPHHLPLIYVINPDGTYRPMLPKEDQRNHLMACDATGMGCCLMRVSLFERIEKPWFLLEENGTEDVYFMRKCMNAGISTHVDTGLPCGHAGPWGIIFPHYTPIAEGLSGHIVYADRYLEANGMIDKPQPQETAAQQKE